MNTPGILQIPSMRDRCSAEEWQARVDLAACYRLVALYGMADMMANHISSRVPGEDGAFLINPYGMMYEEMTASCLIKVDHEGAILSKPDFGALNYGINKAGYVIHSAVHAARHEVRAGGTARTTWKNAGCAGPRERRRGQMSGPRGRLSRGADSALRAREMRGHKKVRKKKATSIAPTAFLVGDGAERSWHTRC